MKKNLVKAGMLFVISLITFLPPLCNKPGSASARRVKDAGLLSLFANIRYGEDEFNRPYSRLHLFFGDAGYRIEIYAEHMEGLEGRGHLMYDSAFMFFRIYKDELPVGYYVIFPTQLLGYQVAYSQKSNESLSPQALELINQAKQAFSIEEGITTFHKIGFQPRSMDILSSYLGAYFYARALSGAGSNLEAFISATDAVTDKVMNSWPGTEAEKKNSIPSADTIISRLISVYPNNDFSGYGFYYEIAKKFPGGIAALKRDLLYEIEGLSYQDAQSRIADFIINKMQDRYLELDLRSRRDVLLGLGAALNIVSIKSAFFH